MSQASTGRSHKKKRLRGAGAQEIYSIMEPQLHELWPEGSDTDDEFIMITEGSPRDDKKYIEHTVDGVPYYAYLETGMDELIVQLVMDGDTTSCDLVNERNQIDDGIAVVLVWTHREMWVTTLQPDEDEDE